MDLLSRQARVAQATDRDRWAQGAGKRRCSQQHRRDAQIHPGLQSPGRGDDERARALRCHVETLSQSRESRLALERGQHRQEGAADLNPSAKGETQPHSGNSAGNADAVGDDEPESLAHAPSEVRIYLPREGARPLLDGALDAVAQVRILCSMRKTFFAAAFVLVALLVGCRASASSKNAAAAQAQKANTDLH